LNETNKRNGFVSFLFGLVGAFGLAFTIGWIYNNITGAESFPIIPSLITLVAGFIITFYAWRNRATILFLIILGISVPGWLAAVGVIPEHLRTSQSSQTTAEATATVTSDALNLRSGPSASHKIIKTLKKGDTLTVTGAAENGWVPVRHGRNSGYVNGEMVSVSAAPSSQAAQSVLLAVPPSAWQQGSDPDFVKRTTLRTGTETVNGEQKEVMIAEVNLQSGSGWVGGQVVLERTNVPIISQLRQANGVRFSVLGDGKPWKIMFPLTETESDWCSYEYEIKTARNSVVELNIPYSSLKQPSWGKQVRFNKNNITAVVLQRGTDSDFGTSTIKVFDFEIY
jgi:uncharacterized protein YraI